MDPIKPEIQDIITAAGIPARNIHVEKARAVFGEHAYHVTIYAPAVIRPGEDHPRVSEADKELVQAAQKALFSRFKEGSHTEYFRDGSAGRFQIYLYCEK